MSSPVIVLMAGALRLADNAALLSAVDSGRPVIPVFIYDQVSPKVRALGAASRWWLLQSLIELEAGLATRGSRLIVRQGKTQDIVSAIAAEVGAAAVHLQRGYTPAARDIEKGLHETLEADGIEVRRFGGHLLVEPEAVKTKTGGTYSVFSPFWRAAAPLIDDTAPLPVPDAMNAPATWPLSEPISSLGLEPEPAHWAEPIAARWQPGEAGARTRLAEFLATRVGTYREARDFPAQDATSALSPYLAFGEISPRTLWWEARGRMLKDATLRKGGEHFLRELGWREFSNHLLFHYPHMQSEPMRSQFKDFPWASGRSQALERWQRGQTGFPIVDAGMRQLWQTGWMHNRVRMIVASFLVKDLLWHWRDGEAWFWDTLVDADFGNNIASWQWVAGCGADAAPYFRIFNPVTQGEKFDPSGDYVRTYVPELAGLPDSYIHKPFEAPEGVLQMAGVTLGKTYPEPIVDRKAARARALTALESIKQAA